VGIFRRFHITHVPPLAEFDQNGARATASPFWNELFPKTMLISIHWVTIHVP
jgi:hypothetical protein